jgi:hypothetical protein
MVPVMSGNTIFLTRIDRAEDLSVLSFQIVTNSKTTPGISWIFLNFSSGSNGLGAVVDLSIPFQFYDTLVSVRRSRNLLQSNKTDSVVSIWPSYGNQNKESVVTVRFRRWQRPIAEWTDIPSVEELQVISLCSGGGETIGLCRGDPDPDFCAQRVECNQQIPLSSITLTQDNIITLQYRTLPSSRTGRFVHMLSYRGSKDISLAPWWNFEYTTADFATVDLVVPSHSPTEGGSTAQIFLSQLRVHSATGMSPTVLVKIGSSAAIITSLSPWDSINGTVISVRVPPSATATPGFANMSVTVSSSQSYSILFEYVATDSLKIISISPSRGPADGSVPIVLLIERNFFWSQGPNVYHVAVDGVNCLTSTFQIEQSTVSAGVHVEYVSLQVPPHAPGMASVVVSVGNTARNLVSSAAGQFWFESELRTFGVINTWSPIDGLSDLAPGGTLLAAKLRNCPSTSLQNYFVTVAGNSCELMRLDLLSASECALFLSTLAYSQVGLVVATIQAHDAVGNLFSADTVFEISRGTKIRHVYPSAGPISGTTVLQLLLSDFPKNSSHKDITVLFGGVKGTVTEILLAGLNPQFAIQSPPYHSATGGLVLVEISCPTCSQEIYLTFDYLYTVPRSKIVSISSSSIQLKSGIPISVHLQNFPLLQSVDHVLVNWGGFVSNSVKKVIASNEDNCILLLDTPEILHSELERVGGDILVLVTPVMDGLFSVAFNLHIQATEQPRILTLTPSMGPSNGGFIVDVLIHNFPFYPPGSYDENYLDISGPIPPFIYFQRTGFTTANLVREIKNSEESSLTQISFNVPYDPLREAGKVEVNIGAFLDEKVFANLSIWLSLLNPEKAVILSVSQSAGFAGVSGSLVTVVAGNLLLSDQGVGDVIITAGTAPCAVRAILREGYRSEVTFQVSSVLSPGLVNINIFGSPHATRSASFQFLVLPSCRAGSDAYQTSDYVRPSRYDWFLLQPFGLSACIDERMLSPQILMLMPTQGSANGGTIVQLYCSGFFGNGVSSREYSKLELSDILVFIGGSLCSVQSFLLDHNNIRITVEVPSSTKPGSVLGSVNIFKLTDAAAPFFFSYYDEPKSPPLVVSVLPSRGSLGTNVSVAIQVCFFDIFRCLCASDKFHLNRFVTGLHFKITSVF